VTNPFTAECQIYIKGYLQIRSDARHPYTSSTTLVNLIYAAAYFQTVLGFYVIVLSVTQTSLVSSVICVLKSLFYVVHG
jgi:hypothetical protein